MVSGSDCSMIRWVSKALKTDHFWILLVGVAEDLHAQWKRSSFSCDWLTSSDCLPFFALSVHHLNFL